MKKAICLFSGGLDSSTALAMAVKKYGSENVLALSVFYNQKHAKELEAAKNVAKYYNVELKLLDLASIFSSSSCSLLSSSQNEVPLSSYEEQAKKEKGPLSTYVPFRNGLFLAVAASIGLSNEAEIIYYGAHADDAILNAYPDTSTDFNKAVSEAIYLGSGKKIKVEAPFINLSKAEVVKIGLELKVPYKLTWSCYLGHDKPCGKCGTCIDRIKAFEANGVKDPLIYEGEEK
ncbi:MAG: 7-cyano-7-deazaguanine synthase QueC [Firmicutes bacterium]|uniref:7-cyano-7-deazaguanine synthase n=1 Tax=Candidatus Scatoplasma merdavium TaxID=2840932 RepID=A0A9D9D7R8_9BACL|nr:7-cyano-7-deazaguanine synthase QueC [Candidatus Scatoplasma merdavium]